MFKIIFIIVIAFGTGVAFWDTAKEYEGKKPQPMIFEEQKPLDSPILKPDATVQQCTTSFKCGPEKRYYSGMRK